MEWVSTIDELPQIPGDKKYASVMVIACYDGYVSPMVYERSVVRGKAVERWKFYWDRIADVEVTHWMLLPKPPKEESSTE